MALVQAQVQVQVRLAAGVDVRAPQVGAVEGQDGVVAAFSVRDG
ncbi:hypothetical protein [Streptomyces sp. CB02460]|nr:hypothetical protein [Streptomyces sp. CB02460]